MNKAVFVGGFALLAIGLCGCGSGNDGLIKQQIAAMNDLAAAIEKGEPEPKLMELSSRMSDINKRLQALKLPEAELKKLTERHQKEMVAAAERLQKAIITKGMGNLPALPNFNTTP